MLRKTVPLALVYVACVRDIQVTASLTNPGDASLTPDQVLMTFFDEAKNAAHIDYMVQDISSAVDSISAEALIDLSSRGESNKTINSVDQLHKQCVSKLEKIPRGAVPAGKKAWTAWSWAKMCFVEFLEQIREVTGNHVVGERWEAPMEELKAELVEQYGLGPSDETVDPQQGEQSGQ